MNKTYIKVKFFIGLVFLGAVGLLLSKALCLVNMDWLMFIAVIISLIIYLKFFSNEIFERFLFVKLSKYLSMISIVFLCMAVSLLPNLGFMMAEKESYESMYLVSYFSWMLGLYFMSIKAKYRMKNEDDE